MATPEQEVLTVYKPHKSLGINRHLGDIALYSVPLLCVAYFTYLAAGLQVDDALIYLRYVRTFTTGMV